MLHGFGWPLDHETGGGLFMYHWGDNFCSVGFVVHLNYKNPWLDPFGEFQRAKTHPAIAKILSKAASASAMARAPSPKAVSSRCPNCRSQAVR